MALKDSFINLNKALRTTLQNVPAVVDTLIRGFDEIGDAAEAEGTYSTTERVVGKWIDGSDIYEKTVNTGALPNASTKEVAHGITDLGMVISIQGIALVTAANRFAPMPVINPGETDLIAYFYIEGNNIIIKSDSNFTGYDNSYVTIKYTKASASRSPEENNTKNVIDDEPVVKTVEDPDVKTTEEPAEDLKK